MVMDFWFLIPVIICQHLKHIKNIKSTGTSTIIIIIIIIIVIIRHVKIPSSDGSRQDDVLEEFWTKVAPWLGSQ